MNIWMWKTKHSFAVFESTQHAKKHVPKCIIVYGSWSTMPLGFPARSWSTQCMASSLCKSLLRCPVKSTKGTSSSPVAESVDSFWSHFIVGGFNPSEKYSRIGSSPQVGLKITNIWNHHPVLRLDILLETSSEGQFFSKKAGDLFIASLQM